MTSLGKIRFRTIQAWASNPAGDDFTLTFDSALAFTAIINTNQEESYVPVVDDFAGQWQRYKPQLVSIESTFAGADITIEDFDPSEPDTVVSILNGIGNNATPASTWTNTWQFEENTVYLQDFAENITLYISPLNHSNIKTIWRFTYNDPHTLSVPASFHPKNGSILPGLLMNGITYIMEAVAYLIDGTEYVLYDITQVS